ncbi:MAG TPA: ATP-binding cassette domain-containing protein [Candidatus Scatomorpha intestinigallinarum]|uniref:ATP-binding cassette domain-containing protein n=1 Tax=Candidatus Scatomorpha intestinigallinarum TaxID=2840923 RepID=A0A9D1DLI5_9FIRM|nr:ATP-binding cassette domain-containing protein [Candidatus Scatomorpha intestinigallinarum]
MKNERINYTQVVWEITRLLQDAESLEEALRTSLGEVVKAVGAEAGTIWFYNSKGDKRIYPSFTIGGADLTGMSLAEGEGIAGQVVKEGKTTVVKDCQSDARWAGRFDESTGFVTKSMVCVPLINKYEVIGCIQIINKKDGSLYNDADVDLCENLAMLTAIAIDDKGLNLGFAEEKKSIISLRGVTKVFGQGDTQIQILKGVNLDVREGEFLVILGESGCGKSTMLNIIGGMDKLTGGSFLFDGVDYSNADEKTLTMYRRHSVGFIFQAYNLMPTLTAKENPEFIGELCEDPMDAEDALERVGLLGRKDNYPSQMSGGQQQRVSIARALMKKPRLILADEPTAALDYETSIEVLTVLEDVIKAGTTMLMVTHNEEIAKMANRVIRMKGGVVAEVIVNRHPAAAKELVW